MKLLHTLALGALIAFVSHEASAQSASTQGHAQVDVNGETTRLTIRGPAAAALYDILVKKEGATLAQCEVGSSVVAGPFACNRRPDGTTFCTTSTGEAELGFTPVDMCLQPQLSIIGVGSIREVEDDPTTLTFPGGGKPFIPGVTMPGRKPPVPPCLPFPK